MNGLNTFDSTLFVLVNIHMYEKNFDECTKCAVFSLTPESSPDLLLHEARDEIPTLTLTWPDFAKIKSERWGSGS